MMHQSSETRAENDGSHEMRTAIRRTIDLVVDLLIFGTLFNAIVELLLVLQRTFC
jgi:hypothetical protein